ncbi:MAG: patatin-like phospholipase family protein [Polyangiaceae bacterium]|nr:patatin-like phospholipase family protein [Polyangiaceae bacterium]MBK8939641.1 patatin-like phospholipase family protein [Polyangiaceae bacterium]
MADDAAPRHLAPTLADALRGRRFGLVLSAGYFGFFGHAGLLAALEAAGLEPAAWAGTSAGALVAAMGAAGMSSAEIAAALSSISRRDFWDPAPLSQLWAMVSGRGATGLLAGERFRALLHRHLPVRDFEACAKPLVIVTSDISGAAPRVHDRGPLAVAVHASCAYPGLFRTVEEGGAQLWDGGLIDKAPLVALADRVERLEALLVMYLPSDTKEKARAAPRRHGFLGGLNQGLAAVRHEHYVLQARLCEARGIPVYELSPALPQLGPNRLEVGPSALEAARSYSERALAAPARGVRVHGGDR